MNYSSLRRTTSVGFNQMRQYLKPDEKLNENLLLEEASSGVWKCHQLLDEAGLKAIIKHRPELLIIIPWPRLQCPTSTTSTASPVRTLLQRPMSSITTLRMVSHNKIGIIRNYIPASSIRILPDSCVASLSFGCCLNYSLAFRISAHAVALQKGLQIQNSCLRQEGHRWALTIYLSLL